MSKKAKTLFREETYKVSQWLQILKEPWRSRLINSGFVDVPSPNIAFAAFGSINLRDCRIGFERWYFIYNLMWIEDNDIVINKYIQPKYQWVFKAKIKPSK